jgi:hypothetical protein
MRYYVVQVHSQIEGWQDLPGSAYKSQSEANRMARQVTSDTRRITRTIRKTKGWEPMPVELPDLTKIPVRTEIEILGPDIDFDEGLKESEEDKLIRAQRKTEKKARRVETARLRIPTEWDRLK